MSAIIDALDREWNTYDSRPEVRRFMASLASHPMLGAATADELVQAIRLTGRTDPVRADIMLSELMRLVPADHVAQRIVLQTLLPGLCCIIGRMIRSEPTAARAGVAAEVISLAGLRIASFPIERRPRAIACNVLLDVERDYRTQQRRRNQNAAVCLTDLGTVSWEDPAALDAFDLIDNRVDLRRALAEARSACVIEERDWELVIATRYEDHRTGDIAERCRLSADSARRARHRAETRLASFYRRRMAA